MHVDFVKMKNLYSDTCQETLQIKGLMKGLLILYSYNLQLQILPYFQYVFCVLMYGLSNSIMIFHLHSLYSVE